jgi:hypothetical protein
VKLFAENYIIEHLWDWYALLLPKANKNETSGNNNTRKIVKNGN